MAAVWYDEVIRMKLDNQFKRMPTTERDGCQSFYSLCCVDKKAVKIGSFRSASGIKLSTPGHRAYSSEKGRQVKIVTKFRSVGKMGPDKTALSSFIRLFEPMVVKALKVS